MDAERTTAPDQTTEESAAAETVAPHSCQPPQDHLPAAGDTWTCPECGRQWRLLDVEDDPARGGPAQHMYWAVEGDPPPPKFQTPDA
jgi:hypothetical protein